MDNINESKRYCAKCNQYELSNTFNPTSDDPLGQYCCNCKEDIPTEPTFNGNFKFNIGDTVYLYCNPRYEYIITSRLFTYIESKVGVICHRSYTVDYNGGSYPVTLREDELTLINDVKEV